MKLESFKFQDGKVFWLPGYPEEVPIQGSSLGLWKQYDMAVAHSLASAIEVAPEDSREIKFLCFIKAGLDNNYAEREYFLNKWQPENGKVYSAECEMEIKEKCRHGCRLDPFAPRPAAINVQDACLNGDKPTCVFYCQVARLKLKPEIFPAANSHDMKDDDL